jgi:hypothetical protein
VQRQDQHGKEVEHAPQSRPTIQCTSCSLLPDQFAKV